MGGIHNLRIGDKYVMEYIVREDDSPRFLADKGIYVLSTPRMIALMETAAKELIDERIGGEYTSVGYHVDVYHKAPAPAGSKLEFIAEIIGIDGRRIVFNVKCLHGDRIIGEGIHERVIVSWERFMEKVRGISE